MLDGTYRLDFDATQQIANGDPTPYDAFHRSFAFRSACTSHGCVATGTRVKDGDPSRGALPGFSVVLDYVAGKWQTTFSAQEPCRGHDVSVLVSWSLEASDDDTLTGTRIESSVAPGCAYNTQMPVEVIRLGDRAPGVAVAAPEGQPALEPSVPSRLSGRYSGKVTNPVTGATETRPVTIESACVRNTDQCRMLKTLTHNDGSTVVQAFHYANGKWETDLEQESSCTDGSTGDANSHWEYVMPTQPKNPIAMVSGTQHQVSTGKCATTADFDLSLVRTGD